VIIFGLIESGCYGRLATIGLAAHMKNIEVAYVNNVDRYIGRDS
jgi:hypothetical protein